MDDTTAIEARAGALNLLTGCVGAAPGDAVLIVQSDGADGYDTAVADFVRAVARDIGCRDEGLTAPSLSDPEHFSESISDAMEAVDHTIFFSSIGDQFRFCETPGQCTKTMTYALSLDVLASSFCRVPHGLMAAVLEHLNAVIAKGGRWRITCPLGTELEATSMPLHYEAAQDDFTVSLFLIGIFRPLDAADMTGRLATRWINPTLNRIYEPAAILLGEPVLLELTNGRITGFVGSDAARVEAHYDHVASLFDLDSRRVFSWHAGINPRTWYDRRAADSLTRWGSIAFNSPRYTHFHTCGSEPPGEISPVLIDATISFEGDPLWREGRFAFLERADVRALTDAYPESSGAFEPCREIGL